MTDDKIRENNYPRPDLERATWYSLNGEWDFEFDDANLGESESWYKKDEFSRKIIVPFCFQSKMSGINDQEMHEYMWYSKCFELTEDFTEKRVILNFGAVDYIAKVWVNGNFAGFHKGGYTPFKMDITDFLKADKNLLVVKSEDKYECTQPRGKQYWKSNPDRCWYTATSGIWQSVWLDIVGDVSFDKIRFTPDIDKKYVAAELYLNKYVHNLEVLIKIYFKGSEIKTLRTEVPDRILKLTIDIKECDYVDEIHYWTPETPNLYDVELILMKSGQQLDLIKSYFGMRKISVKGNLVLLNNKPYYQKLILDQGYWPESLLTPPNDEAIINDIESTKKFGFNGARKHQKIEDPRYYYWADRLGLLVWGEMPSCYEFNTEAEENICREMIEFINRDYNHPCIISWVPLNESWGVRNILTDMEQQNFARALYYLIKAMDATRLVSTNDGWEQVDPSDICGIHDYEAFGDNFSQRYIVKEKLLERDAQGRLLYAQGNSYKGQPVLITEYGGIGFEDKEAKNWGYNGSVQNGNEFLERYAKITRAIRNTHYICGYCYTQLSDVQQEVNGLMTFDRKPKVDFDSIQQINS